MIDALYKIETRAKQLLDEGSGALAIGMSDRERADRALKGRRYATEIQEAAVRLLKILEK